MSYEKSLVTCSNNGCHQLCYFPASGISNVIDKWDWSSRYSTLASTFDIFIDAINMHLFRQLFEKLRISSPIVGVLYKITVL